MTTSWAILRQVVIATAEHESDTATIRKALGLGAGFADPELHELAFTDATMPVSDRRYLEFVGVTDPGSSTGRWVAGLGGRGGFVLSVQVPDTVSIRTRARDRGVRVAVDETAFGHPVLQLHPKDVGLVLEVDGIPEPDMWFWDDIDPGPEPDAGVDEILGVEVPVADPAATAELWHELLDLGQTGTEIDLGGAWVRFVPGGPSADWTVHLRRAGDSAAHPASDPALPGITFRFV